MKKNTFLTHLDVLTPAEARKFEAYFRFINSKSEVLLKIFEYQIKFYRKKKHPPILSEVYEIIFSRKAKTENDIKNLQNGISDLFNQLKEYLIQKKLLESDFEKEFLWLKFLEKKGLVHQRELHYKGLLKKEKKNKSLWSLQNRLKLNHHNFFRNNFEKNNPDIELVENNIQTLEDFFVSLQFKYTAELSNRNLQLSKHSEDASLINQFYPEVTKRIRDYSLAGQLYYELNQFLKNRNEDSFEELRKFLFKNENKLSKEDKLTTLLYLFNYLSGELKKGKYNLRKNALELYKFGLGKENILIHNGILDHLNYRNIVNIASSLGEYDWAENFIEDYKKYLDKSTQKENVSIAKAMLYFEKEDYTRVIQNISKNNFSGIYYILLSKIYMLACNYELKESEDLEIACNTFTRYVKRSKKLNEPNKIAAVSFAKILSHLHLKELPKEKIKSLIDDSNSLFFRAWLLNQLSISRDIEMVH